MSASLSLKQASELAKAIRSFIKTYPFDPNRKIAIVIEDDRVIYRSEQDRGGYIEYQTDIAYWSGKSYRKVERSNIRRYKSVELAIKHINDGIAYTKSFNATNAAKQHPSIYKPWDGCACNICVSYRETGKLPTVV